MSKKIMVLVMVLALVAVMIPLPTSALAPFALYRCEVNIDGELAGPGAIVEAYVGSETKARAWGNTTEPGVTVLLVPIIRPDLGKPVSFKVNGILAIEVPDVDITQAATDVTLYTMTVVRPISWEMPYGLDADLTAINIWQYPKNDSPMLLADLQDDMPEALSVVWHYGGPVDGWKWYTPGWQSHTLIAFEPGEYYIGIVTTACQWQIR